jgi:hypothetical protein
MELIGFTLHKSECSISMYFIFRTLHNKINSTTLLPLSCMRGRSRKCVVLFNENRKWGPSGGIKDERGETPSEPPELGSGVCVRVCVDEALFRIRKVEARQNPERYNRTEVLWRGMKDRDLDLDKFKRLGGTELGGSVRREHGLTKQFGCGDPWGSPRYPIFLRRRY